MTATAEIGITDHFVEVPNFRIHYVEAGQGHPLVLLHGSGPGATALTNFRLNIGALAKHFRVIAIDMPGWGESDTQTEGTGRDHPAALIGVLDALGIEKAALVGNSMGGMTSVATALRYPDRVSHLVTMGSPAPTTSLFGPGGGPSEGMRVLLHAYREPTPANMKRLVEVMCYDPAMASDELAQARSKAALAKPEHLDSWNSQFTGKPFVSPYFQLGDQISQITAPTMAIHGRDDRVVNFESSLFFVSRIPDSRLVLINRCGHWAQIEHAEEFNRLVTDFVGR
ncbi:alpha/beta fold hydrolase [Actinoplanes sp. CA-131856]